MVMDDMENQSGDYTKDFNDNNNFSIKSNNNNNNETDNDNRDNFNSFDNFNFLLSNKGNDLAENSTS